MNNHVADWLSAYHDGELRGLRLRQVEQHLATCLSCQAELEALQNLSALLQISDPAVVFLPAGRFAANLALQLPRRPQRTQLQSAIASRWWLVPVSLLVIGVCLQITSALGTVVSLTANSDIFGSQLAWLHGEALRMDWLSTGMRLFGDRLSTPGTTIFVIVNDVQLVIAQLMQRLIPQAVLAAGYLVWLFTWWVRQHDPPAPLPGSFSKPETQRGS